MGKPRAVAGFDSASVMLMATAAALRGEPFPALGNTPVLKPLARLTRRLPPRLREAVFLAGGAAETVSPRRASRVDAQTLSQWACREYPPRRYQAVAVGSASGALVHLCTALDMPWLPQTFLIPVRQRVHPDDPATAMAKGVGPGQALVAANPDLQLHHMHDAVQDRLMVRALTYYRVKRRTLGPAYERFLRERLAPGGTIVLTECRTRWHTTTVGPRHVFQHGAVGGAREEEFHRGSARLASYLARQSSPVRRWDAPTPDRLSPEAEWGFAPELRADVERFARAYGYRVRRLVFDEPESLSPLVADFHRHWYAQQRIPTGRLFAESFLLLAPYWAVRTGSVPFWLTFNTDHSRNTLAAYLDEAGLDEAGPYDEVALALFQNAVETVGMPTVQEWQRVLARARRAGWFAGLRPDQHPRDMGQLASYDDALRRLPARYSMPAPLSLDDFEEFAAGVGVTAGGGAVAPRYRGVWWERAGSDDPVRATMPA